MAWLPYNPNACGCCACELGTMEISFRGNAYFRAGYLSFDGPLKYYWTTIARGWGYGDTFSQVLITDRTCNFDYAFHPPGSMTYHGAITQKAYDYSAFAAVYGDPSIGHTTISTCSAAVNFFHTGAFGVADYYEGDELTVDPITFPLGKTWLVNEISEEEAVQAVIDYVFAQDWGGVSSSDFVDADLSTSISGDAPTAGITIIHCTQTRYRRRFPVPPSGARLRFEWNVYFTPEDGDIELYDQMSWSWDGVVPDGYDPADSATWPVTDWFYTPIPVESERGAYSVGDWVAKCGRLALPDAPTDLERYAA